MLVPLVLGAGPVIVLSLFRTWWRWLWKTLSARLVMLARQQSWAVQRAGRLVDDYSSSVF